MSEGGREDFLLKCILHLRFWSNKAEFSEHPFSLPRMTNLWLGTKIALKALSIIKKTFILCRALLFLPLTLV